MAPMYGTNGLGTWLSSLLSPFKTGLDLSGLHRVPRIGLRWSNSDNYDYDSDRVDLSGGEIAGIVCGSLFGIFLIIWLMWICVALTRGGGGGGTTSYAREKKYHHRRGSSQRSCYSGDDRCSRRDRKGRTVCVEDCYTVRPAERVYPYYNGRCCYYEPCSKDNCRRSCPSTTAA